MGQEIVVQERGNTALASATPYSLTSLQALVPEWLSRDLFSESDFTLPQIIPDDGPRQLRYVAQKFNDALEERAVREVRGHGDDKIVVDPLDTILGELRLRTTIRNESADEARGRFRILREDCRQHPTEVIRDACMAYATAPAKGNRFFPSGYGELLPYIKTALNVRHRTMYQLRKAADEAEKLQAERQRLADDPVDPAAVSQLIADLEAAALERSKDNRKRDYSNLRMPSAEEVAAVAAEVKRPS